jgi:hypothetical protein
MTETTTNLIHRKEEQMLPISSIHDFVSSPLYTEGKFWVSAGGLLWALSQASNRVMNWFREVKEVVLHKLQTSIDKVGTDLSTQTVQMSNNSKDQLEAISRGFEGNAFHIVEGFKNNTNAIVGELREQRADLRMLYMQPLVAANAKARRKPAKLVANSKPKKKPPIKKTAAKKR